MTQVVAYILAAIITLPIPMTFVIYFFARKILKNKKRSLHVTVNIMTFFYILAVNATIFVIFEQSWFSYIFILLIVLLSMFVVLQWKYKEEVVFKSAWKGFWRFSFLLFSFAYIGLTIYGLTDRLLSL
ncbi:DUF3397 family protein [Pontibacillus yanchengensis]|uniref:DUF3397 family protein n=2 Tax=Pontibacillus yanchengensis TaxID=462910 RepID=A0A6I4ZS29_9BACI|nr:DUF3397 domain-containing protein [Pontibacillus yanchengensis]MYL33038.1 DUF3397 family protein [Pontibacillus yanchengensis]MYL52112.1 DUF3397 family protein [Pontibacillus yanchengensis]